jgi:hypothetical protein
MWTTSKGFAVRAGVAALGNSLFDILKNPEDEISARMSELIVGLHGTVVPMTRWIIWQSWNKPALAKAVRKANDWSWPCRPMRGAETPSCKQRRIVPTDDDTGRVTSDPGATIARLCAGASDKRCTFCAAILARRVMPSRLSSSSDRVAPCPVTG